MPIKQRTYELSYNPCILIKKSKTKFAIIAM